MSRSGYLAGIADPRAGHAGRRHHLTVLLPPRRRYGTKPPHPADGMPARQLSAGEAPRPYVGHAQDPTVPERAAPPIVPITSRPGADTPSAFAPYPARTSDTPAPEDASPARLRFPGPLVERAEPDRAAVAPRDAGRLAANHRAPRQDRMTEPGSFQVQSAAAHPAEPSPALAPNPLTPPTRGPASDSSARQELTLPAPEPAPHSAAAREPEPRPAPGTRATGPAPVPLVPPTRAVTDDEPTRPGEHEPARRAAREPTRVHIGTIDLTIVAPPPPPVAPAAPAPPRAARTIPDDAPLSRGLGPWFGMGQR